MTIELHHITRVCVLGGTGFVGRALVRQLSRSGYPVRVLTRRAADHRALRVLPGVEIVETGLYNQAQLEAQFRDFFGAPPQARHGAVINLVGILNTSRHPGKRFRDAHVALPQIIVNACQASGVHRLLHMSALHAGAGSSDYLRSKGEGEAVVRGAGRLAVTVFRPSVIFGAEDTFFNRFARLLALSPLLMPLPSARARFAPIHVEDVVAAFMRALTDPRTVGKAYELCGPQTYTLHELVRYVAALTGRRRLILPLGHGLSWLCGAVMEWLPGKPYSRDNYRSSRIDSVCSAPPAPELGIRPAAIEAIVPGYLGRREPNNRYDHLRRHAAREPAKTPKQR